jgi:hypothetical protein
VAASSAFLPTKFSPHRFPRGAASGFALPLAVAAALVLLLASLASQSALHQARLRNAAALAERQLEDGLASAAHQVVARVVAHHPCLLTLPLDHWPQAGAACANSTQQQDLREGEIPSRPYRLLAWQPAAAAESTPGRVHMELVHRSAAEAPAWRAAFALDLLAAPLRVGALRELGLRGVQP